MGKKYYCEVSFLVTGYFIFDSVDEMRGFEGRLKACLPEELEEAEVQGLTFMNPAICEEYEERGEDGSDQR